MNASEELQPTCRHEENTRNVTRRRLKCPDFLEKIHILYGKHMHPLRKVYEHLMSSPLIGKESSMATEELSPNLNVYEIHRGLY